MSGGSGGGGVVLDALVHVATYPIGRLIMLIIASPFLFVGYALIKTEGSSPGRGNPLALIPVIGVVLTLIAFAGWWKDRKRSRPSPIRWFLLRLAVGGLILGGAMLVTWLLTRRREAKVEPPLAPPLPEEVDQLCQAQAHGELAP
jgi:RsiW-degrading membrane proteinase PrsW (M82 family)